MTFLAYTQKGDIMKKRLVLLMALSLTFAFPGAVMAEENTAEETTEAASDEADASEDADDS